MTLSDVGAKGVGLRWVIHPLLSGVAIPGLAIETTSLFPAHFTAFHILSSLLALFCLSVIFHSCSHSGQEALDELQASYRRNVGELGNSSPIS